VKEFFFFRSTYHVLMDIGHYQNVRLEGPHLSPQTLGIPPPKGLILHITDFMTSSKNPRNVYWLSPLIQNDKFKPAIE
jgi:hypothetical protein